MRRKIVVYLLKKQPSLKNITPRNMLCASNYKSVLVVRLKEKINFEW